MILARVHAWERVRRDHSDEATSGSVTSVPDIVTKVLVTEEGITDGAVVQLIVSALPHMMAQREPSDREVRELAEFIDARVKLGA